ncbi:MAG TPA: 3-isopropylmalate dehydrogenase [Candidatus Dormibacteraeota bacterium]|nr:3-isopropylmalate dehydrogenase [Candidatus Dormibacteraeota bacterium]
MTPALRVCVLPGDGIGPEVTEIACAVLERALATAGVSLEVESGLIGGAALDATGEPLPAAALAAARRADAVLLGAVGGPRWDQARPRPEAGLLALREGLGVFANLRPVRVWPGLERSSVLRPERAAGADILFVRELTGGAYFGRPQGESGAAPDRRAVDTTAYGEAEIRRVAEVAFRAAEARRHHLTSVDKANVLATSRLWRAVVTEVAGAHPTVTVEHLLVDSCALRLLQAPREFDVVVTENLFGDILTDEAAALVGSLGVLPSASLGADGPGLYEPVHGSAPDLVGRRQANPLGAIGSAALCLRHSAGRPDLAEAVEAAIAATIARGECTPDLGGSATTDEVAVAVLAALDRSAAA